MTEPDPTKFRDPVLQFKRAGGALILGIVLLLIEPVLGVIVLIVALIWGITGLYRYRKIKSWLKQRDLA